MRPPPPALPAFLPPWLTRKVQPWFAPVGQAGHKHGVELFLLFAVLDKETLCSTTPQLDMFEVQQAVRDQRLDHALDDIRAKFGTQAVGRASSLRPRR